MQKLNAHGKLVLGVVLALTCALPLACGSDDSNGVPPGDGGAGGKGGTSSAGGAGKGGGGAGKAGAAQAGGTAAGSAGAPEAGAPEMGGEGGAVEAMGGAAGAEEMGGAGGDASEAVYEANLDAACTTEGSLDCSDNGAASDKQDCVDLYNLLGETYAPCMPEQKALIACLAPKPASAFECSVATQDMPSMASAKAETCVDETTNYGNCLAAQP